jgi:CDP-diacylglycerol--serine O-phosphatidyltransferase
VSGASLLSAAITCGNLTAGFLAVVLASRGALPEAAGLVALAAALDAADGPVARRGSAGGEFGANLDSLADLVSFGAAPALALYLGVLHELDAVGLLTCAAFVVCGAVRLARFPLVRRPDRYVGLPIPPAGLALVLLAAAGPPPAAALLAALLLGALMVSRVPFPTLGSSLPPSAERGLAPEEPPDGPGG